ncbi:MAG: LytTR family DNA-binding domain-containing protein [Chitinivibrionia bacterium]|nr:LytTR family DNA-binding domain-containing protein [Chitinivibrionia bacterium]
MKIFIVEDEKVALRRLVRQVEEILPGNEISTFCEIDEALSVLSSHSPDLLILDLNLNGRDGFDILKNIEEKKFETIVVSANVERALEGFNDLGIVYFVPKPYEIEQFEKALQKFMKKRSRLKENKEILIKDGSKRFTIRIDDILYISGAGDFREIHCKNGKNHIDYRSLEKFDEILPDNFIRIHNSYLVDKNNVVETMVGGGGKYIAILSNGDELKVSRAKYKELFGETN